MVRPPSFVRHGRRALSPSEPGDTSEVEIGVLTWNLYHGRDFPPDPALFTPRSRWLRRVERNRTHVQVNRNLLREFTRVLCGGSWDAALLQECPPRWVRSLARACGARAELCLTSRNWFPPVQSALARANPDLLASWEGGSNTILVRGNLAGAVERRRLMLRRRPERRTMGFVRTAFGVCIANLHASTIRALATEELRAAAQTATDWAEGGPLILAGDFNLRPGENAVFEELAERFDLRGAGEHDAIDHILVRGLEAIEGPRRWAAEEREVRTDGRAIRLSDHAPIEARFSLQAPTRLTTASP
jgi:endonuclease/exonuclease/phosphatase family metal-dependent hydrolase